MRDSARSFPHADYYRDRQVYEDQFMIAGVVATLEQGSCGAPDIVYEISKLPGVEVGVIGSHGRRLPITIDSPDQNALEEITRRLQECPGVAFVDVVFVHLEEEPDSPTAVFPEGTSRP